MLSALEYRMYHDGYNREFNLLKAFLQGAVSLDLEQYNLVVDYLMHIRHDFRTRYKHKEEIRARYKSTTRG